jgi:hypothetical protein
MPATAHMDNKVLIVLNANAWNKDTAHEEWIKTVITEDDSLSQTKLGDAKSTKNYWNLIFVSNQKWCYPVSEDNRRFFAPTVSNERVGDHQYFNELHHELDNGGVEEFLYFLLNRHIPNDWTPAQFLPNRTKTHFEALMEDRRNGALKWFISKLKQTEWNEYIEIEDRAIYPINEIVTLISWDQPTSVPFGLLQRIWSLARENDK